MIDSLALSKMKRDDNYLNITANKTDPNKESFFSKQGIIPIPQKHDKRVCRNTLIYNYIRENPLTSCYKISKELKIGYKLVHQAVREMLFAGMVEGIDTLNEFGRPKKLLVVPGGENEVKEKENR